MTRIIAISNHKGGVGKTTSVVNIGVGLSFLNQRVMLIDMDPQANLTQSLGVYEPETSIYEALKGETELRPIEVMDNVWVVPATLDLSGAELELSSEAGREFILRELLSGIKDSFDFIFIDCPPSLGLLTINALTAASEVFIPLQPHFLATKGLSKIMEVIEKVKKRLNKEVRISGVFLTQFDKRKVLHRDVEETIGEYFSTKVFKTQIRENIALAEAPGSGMDIFRYNAKALGAADYLDLCKEILQMSVPSNDSK